MTKEEKRTYKAAQDVCDLHNSLVQAICQSGFLGVGEAIAFIEKCDREVDTHGLAPLGVEHALLIIGSKAEMVVPNEDKLKAVRNQLQCAGLLYPMYGRITDEGLKVLAKLNEQCREGKCP